MSRTLVDLAITSGIPVSTWLAESPRVLETALDLMAGRAGGDGSEVSAVDASGPQMSG